MSGIDEKTIRLRKPLTLGKGENPQTWEEVTLREPTAGELEIASRADTSIGSVIALIHVQTRIPRQVIEKMSQRDLKVCGDFLESFSDASPETSETSSQT